MIVAPMDVDTGAASSGDVQMAMTAGIASNGKIPLYNSPFGMCFAMTARHGPRAPTFADLVNPMCLCSVRVQPDGYLSKKEWPSMAMVSRVIPANSDEFKYDPKVEAAIQKEVTDNILGRGVWDPELVMEWDDVARKDPTAEWVRAHVIVCVKNSELPEEYWGFEARAVINGGDVRNVWGEKLEGVSLYTLPASQDSFRTTVGVNYARGGETITFDVCGAYVQAKRMGPPTWATPPKRMFTGKMKAMRNPVVQLMTWLYGEKGAGEEWAWHLEKKALSLRWEVVEECGGETVYIKEAGTLGVYVDDGYVAAPDPVLSVMLILELGEHVEMKDPDYLIHLLGIHIRRAWKIEHGITTRYLILEQIAYATKILQDFTDENGGPPKVYVTPCLGQKQAELELVNAGLAVPIPGIFAGTCKIHLGSLLFLVRGSRGDMMQSVGSLACKAADWDGACDKRLTRVLGYLRGTN